MVKSVSEVIFEINNTKGYRQYCNGLHQTLSSDGYVRSIVNWTRVTNPERIDALLNHIAELEKQRDELIELHLDQLCRLLPTGCQYMDPPDGGNVEPISQVRRMINALVAENVGLRKFFLYAIQAAFDGCDLSGGDIQDQSLEIGLIKPEIYNSDKHREIVSDASIFEDGDTFYVVTPSDEIVQQLREGGPVLHR